MAAQSSTAQSPTAISLFSGMGGDTLGLKNAGYSVIAFSENNKAAIASHLANFPECELIENPDAKKTSDRYNIIKIPDNSFAKYRDRVDLVFAGFPCQGFSNGGKKLPNDPRNTLFREFIRATSLINPRHIIGENVPGLLSRKTESGELYIDVITDEFNRIGYNITHKVCHAIQHGVPQLRKRLIIVGTRKDHTVPFCFPVDAPPTTKQSVPPANLTDIVKFDMTGALKIPKEAFDMTTIPTECVLSNTEDTTTDDTPKIHPYLRLKAESREAAYLNRTYSSLLSFGKRDSPIHSEIIDIRNPSKTIICTYDHQPRLYVPLKNNNGYYLRCLLPDELKMIQGFPRDFKLCGNLKQKITQIGNAVPPPLIQNIASIISG